MLVRLHDLGDDWRLGWAGSPVEARRFRHADEARRLLGRVCRDPDSLASLRRLLAWRDRPVGTLSDAAVLERCAALLVGGRLRCWRVVPLRASDIAASADAEQDTPQARSPEEVRELREIVAVVEGGYVVRTIASGVTASWDRRDLVAGVETDWDTQALATGVETDWDTQALAAGVDTDWDAAESAEVEADEGEPG